MGCGDILDKAAMRYAIGVTGERSFEYYGMTSRITITPTDRSKTMHESAKCYNGDLIVEITLHIGYTLVRCEYSIYRIDIATNEVTRLL